MRDAHQFVIACDLALHKRFSLRTFAQGLGIESRNLLLTGFVADRELAALYRSCRLFVFPSLYEGAGLPVLEAMTCGAPVAASGTSAIPELLGDGRAMFDPADPADIARCIREVVDDPGMLSSLRERSRERAAIYTWERVAQRTIHGYERALETSTYPLAAPIEPAPRSGVNQS
jgi:glycosyltransferase involved in cell wall biosynthesis